MTQTAKHIKKINSLKWSVPAERLDREIEADSFGTREHQILVQENFEADMWAIERYL